MRKDEQSESSGNVCVCNETRVVLVIMCNERLDILEMQYVIGILYIC